MPEFWQHFNTYNKIKKQEKNAQEEEETSEGSVEVMSRVATAVCELYDGAVSFLPLIHR